MGEVYAQTRIMPLGNSITMGRHGEPAGYRDDLSTLLANAGVSFDMVGSMDDGTGFYPKHEGHSGYRADEIYDKLNYWLNKNPSDIVLLHIGTNDISEGQANDSTILDIENILDLIHNKNSNTTILFCSLIPRFDPYYERPERTEELNELIYQLYNSKLSQGYDIYYVDQNSAIKTNPNWTQDYMDDYVHPNDLGYHVMAETFYNMLIAILNQNQYAISGNISYYSNDNPINDVEVNLSGTHADSYITGMSGYYEFNNLSGGANLNILPVKAKLLREDNNIITMYNAALTLRHAVGIETLSAQSQVAADVNKDGEVLAYDAAIIARYVIKLPEMENDYVGEWVFQPGERNYQNLSDNFLNENHDGILLGDVNGAWGQSAMAKLPRTKFSWEASISSKPGDVLSVPLSVFEDSLLSFDAEVEFPDEQLKFLGISTFDSQLNFCYSIKNNIITMGGYTGFPLKAHGEIVNMKFAVIAGVNDFSNIELKRINVNNAEEKGWVAKLNVKNDMMIPNSTLLANNYPNPFNPETTISYSIPEDGFVTIKIFNMLGRQVRVLLREFQNTGKHKVIWDGCNNAGMRVANGIYMYRLQFNDQFIEKTMIKIE